MKFPESDLAHYYLDSLAQFGKGIEIGGSSHNRWGIPNVINVDYIDSVDTVFKKSEIELCGETLPVDVVALAHDLPFPDDHFDFLLNSHVFEHQVNPVKTLLEWHRVIRNGGIIFSIIALRDAIKSDAEIPVSKFEFMLAAYALKANYETTAPLAGHQKYGHYFIYTLESFITLVNMINEGGGPRSVLDKEQYKQMFRVIAVENPDRKVGNGFTCVLEVIK